MTNHIRKLLLGRSLVFSLFVAMLLLVGLSACGKKGPPQPVTSLGLNLVSGK